VPTSAVSSLDIWASSSVACRDWETPWLVSRAASATPVMFWAISPLPVAASAALCFHGLAVGWWVFYVGVAMGALSLIGWVYEYYRGAHAH
jgi:hypothetical protein